MKPFAPNRSKIGDLRDAIKAVAFEPMDQRSPCWLPQRGTTNVGDDRQAPSSLPADCSQQKLFLLVGPKRSGKSTIAQIIEALLGEHNVVGPTLGGLGTNFGLSPLIDKPVAIIADARLNSSSTNVITERLLSITLTVDRKYKKPWTGQIPARLVVLSNELPRLRP